MTRSTGGLQYWGDQQNQVGQGVFGPNGIFSQFLAGKPNAGFDRAQANALEQLKQSQAQAGTLNTPLGTRQQADFLQKSTQGAGDQFYSQLSQFMQPAGQRTRGATGLLGGKG